VLLYDSDANKPNEDSGNIFIRDLLPIKWVIFWNLSVIPVFDGDAMADDRCCV
jgi:hypothetical protein